MGFEPVIPGFIGYRTPVQEDAQRKLPKMYLSGNIPESSTYNNQTPVHGWFDLLMKS